MGYRPFGKFERVGIYPVGDQWPAPPEDIRAAVDGPMPEPTMNGLTKAFYRWLERPRFWPSRWRRKTT